jgi:hypothetical protein
VHAIEGFDLSAPVPTPEILTTRGIPASGCRHRLSATKTKRPSAETPRTNAESLATGLLLGARYESARRQDATAGLNSPPARTWYWRWNQSVVLCPQQGLHCRL